jgi:hypothetical protein
MKTILDRPTFLVLVKHFIDTKSGFLLAMIITLQL